MFGLFSCNKESIKITGSLKGSNASEVELKLKSRRGNENIILTDLAVEDGEFDAYLENVKPPCKMTLVIDGEKEYDFWIFRYGKFDFEIDENEVLIVNNSIENSEYDRIQKNYHKMYLVKLQEKEKWVQTHEIEENLTEEDEAKLFEYRKEIKKAYKLRKKSILSTFRKNPQNPIAMAFYSMNMSD